MTAPTAGNSISFTDADFRRAAGLLAHYASNDGQGVVAIVGEAQAANRLPSLCMAIPAVIGAALRGGWDAHVHAPVLQRLAVEFAHRDLSE